MYDILEFISTRILRWKIPTFSPNICQGYFDEYLFMNRISKWHWTHIYFRDIYSTKCYGQMSKKKSLSFPLLKFWAYMENNRDNINFPSFSGFLILNGTPILNGFDFFFFYILWYDKKSVSWTCAWLTDCRNFPRWDMLQILCR